MSTEHPGASRRAGGRIAAVVAAAAILSSLLALLPGASANASSASAPRISRALPGQLVEVRAGHRTTQTPPILAAPTTRGPRSADIQVTYNGFSAQAQAAFQAAVDVWESRINSPQPIRINANWTPLGTGVLGSAGPTNFYLLNETGTDYIYPVALAEARCNCAANGTSADITANFNSAFSDWYLGTDGNGPASDYDFMTVVLHEIGHGLGFLSSFYVSGTQGGWGFSGTTASLRYDFAEYNQATAGTALTNTSVYPNPSAALKTQLTDNSVYFNGTNVNAANGGARARLFAPNPYQPGSSNSHFDENTFPSGSQNALMTPYLDNGEAIHEPGPLTLALFRDLTWTTNEGGATPSIAVSNRGKLEGTGTNSRFKFRVTLSAASASSVSVQYATANGTAAAGSDYQARTGTVTFPAGITTRNITVTVVGDSTVEPNETFNVNLTSPVGATIADAQGRGTIRNDD